MADAKISELLELATTPADNDLFVVVDQDAMPATTKKIQYQNLVLSRLVFVYSRLNTNQATGAVNGVFTTLAYNNDYATYLDSKIDRPSTTQFRALVAGWYRVSYEMYGVPAANDRGAEFRIIKNGIPTGLTGSKMQLSRGQASATQAGFGSKTFAVQLDANDYIEIQAAPQDGTVVTIQDFSTVAFELMRII